MRRQDWTEQLVEKLDSYTDVNLDNLWEGIEKGLDAQSQAGSDDGKIAAFPVGNDHGAGKRVWKRVGFVTSAVAAAAAALIVLVRPHDNPYESDSVEPALTASLQRQGLPEEIHTENTIDIVPEVKTSVNRSAQIITPEEMSSMKTISDVATDSADKEQSSGQKTIPDGKDTANKASGDAPKTNGNDTGKTTETDRPGSRQITMEDFLKTEGASLSAKTKRTNRLAFYAGSNYSAQDLSLTSYDMDDYHAPVYLSNDATPLMKSPSSGHTVEELKADKDFDWNVSTSIGAWVGWYPYHRVMLSTGLLFTSLDGDYNNGSLPQKAGYIGLPLRIGYALVNKDRLNILASAGARFDCLVKEPEAARLNRWQSSAYAGVQSDFMFSQHIGFSASLGTDIYFPSASNGCSPFSKVTAVPSVTLGLILSL